MKQTESDERLMQRVARGDELALRELTRRWGGPLGSFIARMCRSLGCSDDVQQDVWMRLFLYRKRYDPSRPFRGYLFRIAVNCCRNALYRDHVRREYLRISVNDPDQLASESDPPPMDVLIAEERDMKLHLAISRLPFAQRAVVLLYFLCGTDYKQIATILRRSPRTVRSNMHHALRKLRGALTGILEGSEIEVNHD